MASLKLRAEPGEHRDLIGGLRDSLTKHAEQPVACAGAVDARGRDHQLSNAGKSQPERLRPTNEGKSLEVSFAVESIAVRPACRRLQHSSTLIETERSDGEPRTPGNFADRHEVRRLAAYGIRHRSHARTSTIGESQERLCSVTLLSTRCLKEQEAPPS